MNSFCAYYIVTHIFLTTCPFPLLIRGQIKLADFGLARLYNSEERWASYLRSIYTPYLSIFRFIFPLVCVITQISTPSCLLFSFSVVHTPIKWLHYGTVPQSYFWEKRGTRQLSTCGAAGKSRTDYKFTYCMLRDYLPTQYYVLLV